MLAATEHNLKPHRFRIEEIYMSFSEGKFVGRRQQHFGHVKRIAYLLTGWTSNDGLHGRFVYEIESKGRLE